jgi:hypothetical protein
MFMRSVWYSLLAVSLVACGGAKNDAPPPLAPKQAEVPVPEKPRPQVMQEFGSLDIDETNRALRGIEPQLMRCHEEGLNRVEYLGGDVKFYVRLGIDGRVKRSKLEQSTLGDRTVEQCMLHAFVNAHWPKPLDGDGEVRKEFGFSPAGKSAKPMDVDRLAKPLAKIEKEIKKCKAHGSGAYQATLYVAPDGEEGTVATASVLGPGDNDGTVEECLIDALKEMKVPSPGNRAVKVQFTL